MDVGWWLNNWLNCSFIFISVLYLHFSHSSFSSICLKCVRFSLANSFISSSSIWDFVRSFPEDFYSSSLFGVECIAQSQGSETSEASSVTSCFPRLFFPVGQSSTLWCSLLPVIAEFITCHIRDRLCNLLVLLLGPGCPFPVRLATYLSSCSSLLQHCCASGAGWSQFKQLSKAFWRHQDCIFNSIMIIIQLINCFNTEF